MEQAAAGTLTFFFTDIEGSTRLWEEQPEQMRVDLARHDELVRTAIEAGGGHVFKTTGDGTLAVFGDARAAVAAAASAQAALTEQLPFSVRVVLHTGAADARDGDYFGPTLNRTARILGIGHGGQVLVSQSTAALVGDVELRDLGEHRLRDLSQPERVFQLVIAGANNDFPPLRSLDALPTNLPVQLTTFVGRDDELKHIADLLADHRLVTITGVGGVGKTRLALQVGAELAPEFRDGVWLCELASAEDDDALPDVVAFSLRAPARLELSLLDSIVEFLRAKEILVVVDNCEHLLASVGDLVERVLLAAPGVRVLATSREGLGIPGEQLWPLRSLATPARADQPDVIAAADAVRLFVERARAVVPAFVLGDQDAPAVGEICRRLDGIPLAIELAAARVTAMSPAEIAALLDERFRLLTGGRRRAVERHHTLRATVDWSYSLMDETERAVFDRLGVFAGSFDAAAAQAVAASDGIDAFDVLDALGELVAKSMLGAEQVDSGTRYQLLETLRQYALEQLDARGETDALRRRHAEHYAAFAERIGPLLLGAEELTWRPLLALELDNLRSAVGWALESEADEEHEIALRIPAALAHEAVLARGSGIGGWGERAIDAPASSSSPLRPIVMVTAGFHAFHRGDLDRADDLAREVIETASDHSWVSRWAEMLRANVAASRGQLPEALAILTETAARPELSTYDQHTIHSVIACYASMSVDAQTALEPARLALEAARSLGQPSALALACYANGLALAQLGSERAVPYLEQSIELTDAGASDVVYANALGTLGLVCVRAGDTRAALPLLRRSIAYSDAIGDRPPMAGVLHWASRVIAPFAEPERFATLAGGVVDGWFGPMADLIPEQDRVPVSAVAGAEAALGADRFRAAWARGAALSYEELVALALAELDAAIATIDRLGHD